MADRFRVLNGGATANWDDTAYWSATSGGLGGASAPTSADAAICDANSFLVSTGTLTINVNANCLSMNWTGATNTPRLDVPGNYILAFYGDATFITAMTYTMSSGATQIQGVCTLTTNGITIPRTLQNYSTLTLGSALTVGTGFNKGNGSTFNSGNYAITVPTWERISGFSTANLGSSTINITTLWEMVSGDTLDASTSTIKVTGTGAFTGGGKTYYNVELNGSAHTISGSNTFTSLTYKADTTQTITHTDGTTQTITTPVITGSVGKVKTLQGSSTAGWAITKAGGGTVVCSYMSISYSTASPASTWYANDKTSVNGGFNTGWIFPLSGSIIPKLIGAGVI